MYLKSIKLEGFKSFAKKTEFILNKGITTIVGPNGSGKSNIVDAVRWVLGEQSVKSLRGGNIMSDVIFSGSETFSPSNKASVTLTFDNSDHYLASEYTEIEVKRVVYKDGESEYFINNTKVRLKDVQELFIDLGSSTDSFNIISQGNITDIVNSKPLDRRIIFESAAGVLKYKKRKEESLRKLDKTKDNLGTINLLIDEIKTTIDPLEKEALIAKEYVSLKEEIKENEIFLIKEDITSYNNEYNNLKKEEEELNKKLETTHSISSSSVLEKLKLDIYKIDDEISTYNKKLMSITENISIINSERRVNLERTKYEYSDDKLKTNLLNLKEDKLNIVKDIEIINNDIDLLNENIKTKSDVVTKLINEIKSTKENKNSLDEELNGYLKDKFNLENKIDILEANISNNEKLPRSVQNILNNPRLKGIHNTISNLIEVPDDYLTSVEVAVASSLNFLVVDNETSAKSAINYLKENKLGRATFLPLNIIKSRYVSIDIKERLEKVNGYLGIMSDLIKYSDEYRNVIENQMGNIIVVKDIDAMNLISKILEYKYRIVTLTGEITYAGGSISGGNLLSKSNINSKKELNTLKDKLNNVIQNIESVNVKIKDVSKDLAILENNIQINNTELIELNAKKSTKMDNLDQLDEKLKIINNDIEGINNIKSSSLDKKLDKLMEDENKLNIEKEKIDSKLIDLKDKKDNLNNEVSNEEKKISEANSEYRNLSNKLNVVSVDIGKINVKLDNLLIYLNEEYNMTYDYALKNYDLELDINIVREKVKKLKREIKALGDVNVGSIKEYERLSERYNFLTNQRKDLEESMNNLYTIIDDMDNIMIDKFRKTFKRISEEFTKVFKVMFQGGNGSLELTNKDDFLNTGVELIIEPPGKRIYNTQSLSGGEKSLTAICLLFAILNVSEVPFIILDEVEAALDEVNVDLFGEYLNKKKTDNQYIIITHKKRMMEYADVLYGITMQDAGVSKVVGVKLEN